MKYEWYLSLDSGGDQWKLIPNQNQENLLIPKIDNSYNGKRIKLRVISKLNNLYFWESNDCKITVNLNIDDTNEDLKLGVEGQDWFVLPGKDKTKVENRITIPTTTNKKILEKYGSVPLPWKSDEKITHKDLVDSFSYKALVYIQNYKIDFGSRRISANKYVNAYVDWCTSIRKYFPYVAWSCGDYQFKNVPVVDSTGKSWDFDNSREEENVKNYMDERVLNYDWKVEGTTSLSRQADVGQNNVKWLFTNNEERKIFEEYLWDLFSKVQPGMNDLDKFALAFDVTQNWLKKGKMDWGSNDSLSTNWGMNANHSGVCTTYGGLLAFSLNVLGVKAFGVGTLVYENPAHWNTWVYLDITGKDEEKNRKWYQSDPLWSTDGVNDGTYSVNSAITKKLPDLGWNRTVVENFSLFDPGKNRTTPNEFTSVTHAGAAQFNYGRVAGLVWRDPYEQNKVSFGTNKYWEKTHFSLDADTYRSKFIFIKGNWYYIAKDKNNASAPQFKKVIYHNGFNSKPTFQNVSNLLGDYKDEILQYKESDAPWHYTNDKYRPMMIQIYNKVVFVSSPIEGERKILVVDINEDEKSDKLFNWETVQTIKLNQSKKYWLENLSYDSVNNTFTLYYFDSKLQTMSEKLQLSQFYFEPDSKENKNYFDVIKKAEYLKIKAGNHAIGQGYNDSTYKDKIDFYKKVDEILFKNEQNNFSKNDLYDELINEYDKYTKVTTHQVEAIISSKLINSNNSISLENFRKYGFDFHIEAFTSKIDIALLVNENKEVDFEIYYRDSKPNSDFDYSNFTLIKTSKESKIYLEDLTEKGIMNPEGYYYIKMISNVNGRSIINKTKIAHLLVRDDNFSLLNDPGILSVGGSWLPSNSNFSTQNGGWYDEKFSMKIQYSNGSFYYDNKNMNTYFKLYHINPNNPLVKTLKWSAQASGWDNIKQLFDYKKVDDSNHGVYYLEIEFKDSQTNELISKSYSQFIFLFTRDDIINFDINIWSNIIKKID